MLQIIPQVIDFALHANVHLAALFQEYGTLLYGILFLIVFCETGLVFTPFFPGDSLLFASGALCASSGGAIQLPVLLAVLYCAPLLGDQSNYWTGRLLGTRLPFREENRILKKKYLDQTQEFYARHGVFTILLARFVPIIRTFAPFVAGIGRMKWLRYTGFSALAAFLWVFSFVLVGWTFGNLPAVQKNFTHVILGIVAISFLPMVIQAVRSHRSKRTE